MHVRAARQVATCGRAKGVRETSRLLVFPCMRSSQKERAAKLCELAKSGHEPESPKPRSCGRVVGERSLQMIARESGARQRVPSPPKAARPYANLPLRRRRHIRRREIITHDREGDHYGAVGRRVADTGAMRTFAAMALPTSLASLCSPP